MKRATELKRAAALFDRLGGLRLLLLSDEQRAWLKQWRERQAMSIGGDPAQLYAASLNPAWTNPDPMRVDIAHIFHGAVPTVLESDSAIEAAEKYQRFLSGE